MKNFIVLFLVFSMLPIAGCDSKKETETHDPAIIGEYVYDNKNIPIDYTLPDGMQWKWMSQSSKRAEFSDFLIVNSMLDIGQFVDGDGELRRIDFSENSLIISWGVARNQIPSLEKYYEPRSDGRHVLDVTIRYGEITLPAEDNWVVAIVVPKIGEGETLRLNYSDGDISPPGSDEKDMEDEDKPGTDTGYYIYDQKNVPIEYVLPDGVEWDESWMHDFSTLPYSDFILVNSMEELEKYVTGSGTLSEIDFKDTSLILCWGATSSMIVRVLKYYEPRRSGDHKLYITSECNVATALGYWQYGFLVPKIGADENVELLHVYTYYMGD